MRRAWVCGLLLAACAAVAGAQGPAGSARAQGERAPAGRADAPEARGRQAVVETTDGTFVIDLAPEAAPQHVAKFVELAGAGAYDGTTFFRMVKMGIVQGGDPLTKDPANRDRYGTGGLSLLKDEPPAPTMTRGSVAAVTIPGRPDSSGAQFFIAVVDQPGLDGKYTVFGRVSDGIEVVQTISATPVDAKGLATERVEITHVTIRETPPEPFVNETPDELAQYRAVLDTSDGPITLEFLTGKAPDTVRQFMRLAAAGIYDGMAFHRVAKGFVVQTGSLTSRSAPLTETQRGLVHDLPPEFNDTPHVKGVVSMARGDDPGSATTSFFICTGDDRTALDGKYTAFAHVVDGMAAVDAIDASPVDGETPVTRIELRGVRIEKK